MEATQQSTPTPQTAPLTPRSYLGHPCTWAEVEARDEADLEQVRKEEERARVQRLGGQLSDLQERAGRCHDLLGMLVEMLRPIGDAERAAALAALLERHMLETANLAYEAQARAFVALDCVGVIEESRQAQ